MLSEVGLEREEERTCDEKVQKYTIRTMQAKCESQEIVLISYQNTHFKTIYAIYKISSGILLLLSIYIYNHRY